MGPNARRVMVLCVTTFVLVTPALAGLTPSVLEPADACVDFEGEHLQWTHADCVEVWSAVRPSSLARRAFLLDYWHRPQNFIL